MATPLDRGNDDPGRAETVRRAEDATNRQQIEVDRLVVATDGIRRDASPVAGADALSDAVARHRELTGQAFVDAVANDLLPHVRHQDDVTLLALEMVVS